MPEGKYKVNGDYSKDKKKYKENRGDYNAEVGENKMDFVGNSEGGRDESISDTAGVEDGLGHIAGVEVKNAEMVTSNQRPVARSESVSNRAGTFKVGT